MITNALLDMVRIDESYLFGCFALTFIYFFIQAVIVLRIRTARMRKSRAQRKKTIVALPVRHIVH